MQIEFRVDVAPRGQGRPRFARRGRFVQTYELKKDTEYKKIIRSALEKAYAGEPLAGPIRLGLVACCKVPKSYTKKRKEACLSGREWPTKKPDLDNVVKAVQDAMNGGAYGDDCQIVQLFCNKIYGQEDYLWITVEEIE